MPVRKEIHKGIVPVKIFTDDIQSDTIDQLVNTAQLPFIHHHVAAMPDAHLGIGATVGSVIPTTSAIIPAAVGVDIGCGMMAVQLSLTADHLPNTLKPIRRMIEERIPVGSKRHSTPRADVIIMERFESGLNKILDKHPSLEKRGRNIHLDWALQLGSLGGGNHFIEICLDDNDHIWVMLHSGSRGIGNKIGNYFINLAKQDMGVHIKNLPDSNLAYLSEGTRYFNDYVESVEWAQEYAYCNREIMMDLLLSVLKYELPEFTIQAKAINCHHNYIARERHYGKDVYVTRKGAIRAGKGELGIIPGSMGAASYIVRGKGNAESFNSCAHGAGRQYSRSQARRMFTKEDLREQTYGVECRKDGGVLDEIPGAYKDIEKVMENQRDLVDVLYKLRQIVCVKG